MCIKLEVTNNIIMDANDNIFNILDRKYELSLLFDYYGSLLKDNHQEIFRSYVYDDMSLSEIADELGITRQGVHDSIKRSTKHLQEYEQKLSLISNKQKIKSSSDNIINMLKESNVDNKLITKIVCELDNISKEV